MKASIVIGVTLLYGIWSVAPAYSHSDDRAHPTKFIKAIAPKVYHLLQWPSDEVLDGPNRVPATAPEVVEVKRTAQRWIEKVLDPSWYPPPDITPIFLREEFSEADTVRMRWDHDGYRVEASQTASIMALKITPLETPGTGTGLQERAQYARKLAQELFADKARMDAPGGRRRETVPIGQLKERITSFSFDPETTRELADDKVVVGYERSIQGIGVAPAIKYVEDKDSQDPVKSSPHAQQYWFRNVRWWNDGQSVGFYFLKIDGPGAWIASYVGEIDTKWIETPKETNAKKRRRS